MKTRYYLTIISGVFFLASCGAGGNAGERQRGQPPTAHGFVVQTSDIGNSLEVIGDVLAWEEVELMAEISGRIEQISFTEGGAVKQGQLLVKINDADLKARFTQVSARLALEEKSLARLAKLVESGGVSHQEYDEVEARIEDLKGEKQFLQSQLDKTEVRAPWDGKIGVRRISQGAVVAPGTPIATLRQINPVKIEFKVPERYAVSVQKGNIFSLRADYLGSESLQGTVEVIEPGLERATRSLLLRGKVANSAEKLVPGTSARISLLVDSVRNAKIVPDKAIRPTIKGKEVVVLRNGKAQLVPVETGVRIADRVQIAGDVAQGDTVLTTGLMQVKEGMNVQITKMEQLK